MPYAKETVTEMLIRRDRMTARNHLAESPGGQGALVGADAFDGASTLVYVLGIGFMIYVGLEFVLPALFGATAKTKHAYHRLKSNGESTTTASPYSQPHRSFAWHAPTA